MRGPLRRLAARLDGAAPARVRTLSRLPFAPSPQLIAADLISPETISSASVPLGPGEPSDRPFPRGEIASSPARSPSTPPRPPPELATAPRQPPYADRQTRADSGRGAAGPEADAGAETAAGAAGVPAASVPQQARQGTQAPSGQGPEGLPSPVSVQISPPPLLFQEPGQPAPEWPGAEPSAAPPAVSLPAPLLSSQRPPSSRSSGWLDPAEATSASARAGADATPDEVHVHIGRIEVTAFQESAPAKAPGRRGQPPMSLEDYLARRREERS